VGSHRSSSPGRTVGDGWFPFYPYFSEDKVRADLEIVHESARAAGRDPQAIGLEGAIYFDSKRFDMPPGGRLPPTHWTNASTTRNSGSASARRAIGSPRRGRISGRKRRVAAAGCKWDGVDARLEALRAFADAVGPDFLKGER
jgi:hypothetical protein